MACESRFFVEETRASALPKRTNGGSLMVDLSLFCKQQFQRSRRTRFVLLWLAAVLAFVICDTPALGQSTFGSVVGTVRDASSDVVSGATVSLTNAGTSAKRVMVTDQAGSFSFVNVEPGLYELVVEASGFQKTQFPNLDLQARETK